MKRLLLGWALAIGLSAATAAPLNINTATPAQLETLPGVGPAKARAITEYREKSGGFKRVEDLTNVKGLGEKSVERLKPMVTVTP